MDVRVLKQDIYGVRIRVNSSWKNILSALVLFLPCLAVADFKNESGIHVNGPTKRQELDSTGHHKCRRGTKCEEGVIKWCQGEVPKGVDLSAAGITSEDLKSGVSCYVGDFDGNGYLDFVLYGPTKCKMPGSCITTSFLILFSKKVLSPGLKC
jgi:hypothetical protein